MSIADLLGQLVAAGGNPHPQAEEQFEQVARAAPPDVLGQGVTDAFRADSTPPFPDMVGQLFGQSDASQRAGMLNQILQAVGPAILSGAAGGVLGRVLGGGMGSVPGGGMPGGGLSGGGLGGVLGGVLGGGGLGGVLGGGASGGGLGSVLEGVLGGPSSQAGLPAADAMPRVSPEQASQITPEQMREIAAQAEQHQPGIVDQIGQFAARNPQLVKALGGMAMAVIASRLAQSMQR